MSHVLAMVGGSWSLVYVNDDWQISKIIGGWWRWLVDGIDCGDSYDGVIGGWWLLFGLKLFLM